MAGSSLLTDYRLKTFDLDIYVSTHNQVKARRCRSLNADPRTRFVSTRASRLWRQIGISD
jgi:hypothetical protein